MGSKKKQRKSFLLEMLQIKRSKYIVTLFLFLIWIAFFDKNNLVSKYKLSKMVDNLESEKEMYRHKIEKAKKDRSDLEQNLEKFAREKYFMHKKDEDIFIIDRISK